MSIGPSQRSPRDTLPRELRILVAEDSRHDFQILRRTLARTAFPCQVTWMVTGEETLVVLEQQPFDVLLTDYQLPKMNGLELLYEVIHREIPVPVILMTGAGNERMAVEAIQAGAYDYIVKDHTGEYLQLLPTIIRRTHERWLERLARQQAEVEREQLIADLDAFTHSVAHDLKNPLAAINTYIGTLQMDPTPERARQTSQRVGELVHKMSNIIDELLLLANIRRTHNLPLETVNIAETVREAQKRMKFMIRDYNTQLSIPDDFPTALGYAPWIEQVWINYLSNAIKYGGRPPRVEIGYTQLSDNRICYWVRDNGQGLSPEQRSQLFTMFTRLNQLEIEGHGLGLSIVKRIVTQLGGEVGVESEPGSGSIFSFTLLASPLS